MDNNEPQETLLQELKAEVIDNRKIEEDEEYEYFKKLRGSCPDKPIRVVINKDGEPMGADTINPETRELIKNAALITTTESSPFAENSTETEFYQLCSDLIQEKQKQRLLTTAMRKIIRSANILKGFAGIGQRLRSKSLLMTEHSQDSAVPEKYGDKPSQALDNFTKLYEQAEVSKKPLAYAGEAISNTLQQNFPGLFDDIKFSQEPLEEWDRSILKLIGDVGNRLDPEKGKDVLDLVIGRIVVDNVGQIKAIRKVLGDASLRKSLGIEYAKDRFAVPSDTHYRDITLSVRLSNGHIAEIQINQKDMLAASDFTNDAYEDLGAIRQRAAFKGRDLTAKEIAKIKKYKNFVQDVHDYGATKF